MLTRREFFASSFAGIWLLSGCSGDKSDDDDITPAPSAARKLLWSDEFKNLSLASPANPKGRWRPNDVWQPLDRGYGDFATGQNSTWLVNPAQQIPGLNFNPFSLTSSGVRISCTRTPTAVKNAVNGCKWLGGMLISNTALPEMTFGYGYYEFRARFPTPAQGMFPAMWFYAARDQNPDVQRAAEIDLFEIFGDREGQPWRSTLHGDNMVNVQSQNLDTADWHTYGLDWTASSMDFYYDDKRTASASGDHVKFFAGAKMSIRVDFVMDAQYFSTENRSNSSDPNTLYLELDYIRHYDRF